MKDQHNTEIEKYYISNNDKIDGYSRKNISIKNIQVKDLNGKSIPYNSKGTQLTIVNNKNTSVSSNEKVELNSTNRSNSAQSSTRTKEGVTKKESKSN